MYFIDTHTHLYLDEFKNDIHKVIENAINNGVQKMFLPNINSKTTSSMIDLCKQYPENCFAMIGLHPCEVKKESLYDELDHIESQLAKHNFIGIGEIGIAVFSIDFLVFLSCIAICEKFRIQKSA